MLKLFGGLEVPRVAVVEAKLVPLLAGLRRGRHLRMKRNKFVQMIKKLIELL